MRLLFNQFEGMAPRISPAGLANGLSTHAKNAGFSRGVLSAAPIDFADRSFSDLGPVAGSITRANGGFFSHQANAWFFFSGLVRNGVDSLIAPQDLYGRVYYADENGPKYMTTDTYTTGAVNLDRVSYRLGVPFPALAPQVSKDSEDIPNEVSNADVVRQRIFYVYTLVDDYGHEGAPSLPSSGVAVPVEYPFQVTVTMSMGDTDITNMPFGGNAKKRIYRTTQGTDDNDYQYVGEVDFTDNTFVDTVAYGEEGEVLPTTDWYEPDPRMEYLEGVASNFMAGFFDNMVCFSRIKLPHAWPTEYRFPLKYEVVAIQSTANGLFVGTTGKPYWCFGADPEAAIPQEIDYDYPCVNAEAVVDVGGFVVYPSHDGLIAADGQQVVKLTEELFDRIDWQALDPYTMKAWAYEGRYFFYAPETREIYAVEPGNPRTLTLIERSSGNEVFDEPMVFARNLKSDQSVLVMGSQTAPQIITVENAVNSTVEWHSRDVLGPLMSFNLCRVRATTYPVTVRVYSENNPPLVITAVDENPFKIKRLARARRWSAQIEFVGSGIEDVVESVILAQTTQELTDGA